MALHIKTDKLRRFSTNPTLDCKYTLSKYLYTKRTLIYQVATHSFILLK